MKEYTQEQIQKVINDVTDVFEIALPHPMYGYSSWKVRKLLNKLVGLYPKTIYLEIGVHEGSTFIPAMYGNKTAKGTAIDAWNMFGDREAQFRYNLKSYLGSLRNIIVVHKDFRYLENTAIYQPVDVYFYDGDHTSVDIQCAALTEMAKYMSDRFIFLVDDFNWQEPRDGTYKALRDLNYTVEAEWFLKGPYNGGPDDWWNGLFVGIIRK